MARFATAMLALSACATTPAAAQELPLPFIPDDEPIHVRQRGFSNEEAKDIVQEFLAGALEHGMIPRADPLRGRFRTFLLAALTNFMKDRRRSWGRLKRGGGHTPMSLDLDLGEPRYARTARTGEPPEKIVDRAWAQDLLGRCISELAGKP